MSLTTMQTPLGKSRIWDHQRNAVLAAVMGHQQTGRMDTAAGRMFAAAALVLGVPYDYGKSDPTVGFDCSGLTSYMRGELLPKLGLLPPLARPISRSSTQQAQLSGYAHVPQEQFSVGDICCYDSNHDGEVRHVNVIFYIDDGWVFALNGSGKGSITKGDDPDSYVKVKCVRAPMSQGGIDGPGVYWRPAYVYTVRPQ